MNIAPAIVVTLTMVESGDGLADDGDVDESDAPTLPANAPFGIDVIGTSTILDPDGADAAGAP